MFTFNFVYTEVSGGHPVVALLNILFTVVKWFRLCRMSLVGEEISRPLSPKMSKKIGRDV